MIVVLYSNKRCGLGVSLTKVVYPYAAVTGKKTKFIDILFYLITLLYSHLASAIEKYTVYIFLLGNILNIIKVRSRNQ